MSVLLDTSVVIDCLRGLAPALRYFQALPRAPSISVITVGEILAGVRRKAEEHDAKELFRNVRLVKVDRDIAWRAGVFVRHFGASHAVELADALIAATAGHHGLELATLNVKHFPMFPKLKPAY